MIVVDRDSVPGVLTADLGMVGTDTLTLTTGLSVPDSKSMRIAIMPTCPTLNEQLNATAPR